MRRPVRPFVAVTCFALFLQSATAFGQTPGVWYTSPNQAPAAPAPQPTPAAPPASLPALPAPQSTTVTVTTETTAPASAPRTTVHAAPAAPEPPDVDKGASEAVSPRDRLVEQKFLHGFRLGYAYTANFDKKIESLDNQSLKDKIDMKTPHSFLIGYEGMVRMVGHSWLNVILVGNVMVAGLEQSKFFPTGNALLGFEIDNSFQLGVGASLTPLKGEEGHAIIAAGWTPRVGSFYVPLHAFFIPDVDGLHRTGITTGVTW
jgi:hypothetical protein